MCLFKLLYFFIIFSFLYAANEIKQAFSENGIELDDSEVSELIEEADENKDGVVSFEGDIFSLFFTCYSLNVDELVRSFPNFLRRLLPCS